MFCLPTWTTDTLYPFYEIHQGGSPISQESAVFQHTDEAMMDPGWELHGTDSDKSPEMVSLAHIQETRHANRRPSLPKTHDFSGPFRCFQHGCDGRSFTTVETSSGTFVRNRGLDSSSVKTA